MPLLQLKNISVSFGSHPILDGCQLNLDRGERVCLIGRNGAGKSTLMKVVNGSLIPEDGDIHRQSGLQVTQLEQSVPANREGDLFDVVAAGLPETGPLLQEYHHLSQALGDLPDDRQLNRLAEIQHQLEALGGWNVKQRTETVISRLGLDGDVAFDSLSGGQKRRVLLARALVSAPDVLLLDEPTNHLDIESIDWLESFLMRYDGGLLFVSHDRALIRKLATRIVELDRGQLTEWPGTYEDYLRRKEAALHAEQNQNAEFDKQLAKEEVWIRQGIKARRTRNEGRVRALQEMREQRKARRVRGGNARLQVSEASSSGKRVMEARNISFAYQDKSIVQNLSTTIMRGDKVGIIGPNGSGKTTLINLLLGKLQPDEGEVEMGTRLEVAYFDQHREALNEEQSVIDNMRLGTDFVEVQGKSRHVISYLQDFLFSPERIRSPVRTLSGGEKNRLQLARLFSRPANLLIMDEPTNDLDVETLELLENLLVDYDGTLLLVSHDREFLDNVVTSTLVFEDGARVNEYVGGYQDWLRQKQQVEMHQAKTPSESANKQPSGPASLKKRKLSYRESRELANLPKQIETLETELEALQQRLADPDLYRSDPEAVAETSRQMKQMEQELRQAYVRWEALEE